MVDNVLLLFFMMLLAFLYPNSRFLNVTLSYLEVQTNVVHPCLPILEEHRKAA